MVGVEVTTERGDCHGTVDVRRSAIGGGKASRLALGSRTLDV
jgi:hypothetical protein